MRIIDLMLKDLTQLFRDWKTALFFYVMPIAFTLMFGGFSTNEDVDTRLPVGYINQDDSTLTGELIVLLEKSDIIRVEAQPADLEALRQQITDGELAGGVLIPAGYGETLLAGGVSKMTLILDKNSGGGIPIKDSLLLSATRLHNAVTTAHISAAAYESQQAFASQAARQSYFDTALEKALAAWKNPPIGTKHTQTGQQEEEAQENIFAQFSPAMIMQFAIAGLLGAAEILVTERKSRSLQRLLTTAISRAEILIGHYLAIFLMLFMQILPLMLFGQLALGLDYLHAPMASLLLAVAVAMSIAALGLLIGALSKTSEQVVILSLVPMFIFSGLGGAWVPLEITSKSVQIIGHFSPVAWGMDGFKNILARGLGLEAIWLPAGMLLLFAAGFFGLAVWRFEFE